MALFEPPKDLRIRVANECPNLPGEGGEQGRNSVLPGAHELRQVRFEVIRVRRPRDRPEAETIHPARLPEGVAAPVEQVVEEVLLGLVQGVRHERPPLAVGSHRIPKPRGDHGDSRDPRKRLPEGSGGLPPECLEGVEEGAGPGHLREPGGADVREAMQDPVDVSTKGLPRDSEPPQDDRIRSRSQAGDEVDRGAHEFVACLRQFRPSGHRSHVRHEGAPAKGESDQSPTRD